MYFCGEYQKRSKIKIRSYFQICTVFRGHEGHEQRTPDAIFAGKGADRSTREQGER